MKARRRLLLALGAGLVAPRWTFAQGRVWRVGFLGGGNPHVYEARINALRAGLKEFGYVEGKNLALEFRWAEGQFDRFPVLATELVQSKIDVLVTHSLPATRAAMGATKSVPIVFTDVTDAVGSGLVQSLAHPGGNVTGSTFFGPQLMAKRLEMLHEVFPKMSRVAFVVNPDNAALLAVRKELGPAAKSRGIELKEFETRKLADFEPVFGAIARERFDAVIVQEDTLFTLNRGMIAKLAIDVRLPLAGFSQFAEEGGLIGYGVNFPALYHRAAYFVDRILKGAKPGDIPVEQPTKFDLFVNRKTAKTLGITIPNAIYVRADKIID